MTRITQDRISEKARAPALVLMNAGIVYLSLLLAFPVERVGVAKLPLPIALAPTPVQGRFRFYVQLIQQLADSVNSTIVASPVTLEGA